MGRVVTGDEVLAIAEIETRLDGEVADPAGELEDPIAVALGRHVIVEPAHLKGAVEARDPPHVELAEIETRRGERRPGRGAVDADLQDAGALLGVVALEIEPADGSTRPERQPAGVVELPGGKRREGGPEVGVQAAYRGLDRAWIVEVVDREEQGRGGDGAPINDRVVLTVPRARVLPVDRDGLTFDRDPRADGQRRSSGAARVLGPDVQPILSILSHHDSARPVERLGPAEGQGAPVVQGHRPVEGQAVDHAGRDAAVR